nr:hypothetical protein CFP56_17333 [Quercus suber]
MQRARECWREKPVGGVFTTVRPIFLHLSIPHSCWTKSIEFRSYLQIPAMAKCISEKVQREKSEGFFHCQPVSLRFLASSHHYTSRNITVTAWHFLKLLKDRRMQTVIKGALSPCK